MLRVLGAALGAVARLLLVLAPPFACGTGATLLPGIVGYVPAAPFEMKRTMRNELVKAPLAVRASDEWGVRKFLERLGDSSTRATLILIDRHDPSPPKAVAVVHPSLHDRY
jgi:hypothetical protein